MLKPADPAAALAAVTQPPIPLDAVKGIFKVLHGCYGNLVASKFATGEVFTAEDDWAGRGKAGEDKGMSSTLRVWAHGLRDFDAATIKAATARCMDRHPEFPPSLAQFIALCNACRPAKLWAPPAAPALTMSPELAAQYRAEYRAQLREAAEEIRKRRQHVEGLDKLKQAIAQAVADAGGDEAAELLRLDRMLAPRRVVA